MGSLNALASAYLESLAETNSGCPLEADIGQTAALNSGDLLTITNGAELGLSMASGAYAIYRITKNLTKSTVEIVTPAGAFLALINETTSINGVISNLANSTNALQTLSSGSDSNVQQDAYLTLTDNANDCVILGLGMQAAPPVATMTPSGSNVVYVIPALTNQAGTTITFKDPTMSTGVPAVGFGTYTYPFLWTDSIYVYTDYLNSLHELFITLYAPISFYHAAIGSVTAGGVKLIDAANTSPTTSGYYLTTNSLGLPIWTSSPSAWNGGTVTSGIIINPGSGAVFTANTSGDLTLSGYLSLAGQYVLVDSGSAGNGIIQWGNSNYLSVRLAMTTAGTSSYPSIMSLQWDNNGTWSLGILDLSLIYVDHINSASGNGIYFFDVLKAYSGTVEIADPLTCTSTCSAAGFSTTSPTLTNFGGISYSTYYGGHSTNTQWFLAFDSTATNNAYTLKLSSTNSGGTEVAFVTFPSASMYSTLTFILPAGWYWAVFTAGSGGPNQYSTYYMTM